MIYRSIFLAMILSACSPVPIVTQEEDESQGYNVLCMDEDKRLVVESVDAHYVNLEYYFIEGAAHVHTDNHIIVNSKDKRFKLEPMPKKMFCIFERIGG